MVGFFVPAIAVWFGYTTLFSEKMFAVSIIENSSSPSPSPSRSFTIKPMRRSLGREGLVAALKADTLALTAWQIGMYGLMAFAQFHVFSGCFLLDRGPLTLLYEQELGFRMPR